MRTAARQSASERREAILAASMELFARHGQHGVTTRMIADAAGVSEALLYRHFPGKEALFEELQRWCLRDTQSAADRLAEVPPSTDTLVRAVFFIVHQIAGRDSGDVGNACVKRIMMASLIGDGAFARGFVKTNFSQYVPRLVASLQAAERAGDLVDRPKHPAFRIWATHNLACMVSNLLLPAPPVVEYGLKPEALVEELALFSLRGLGLTQAAIARHFDAKTLFAFTKGLLAKEQLAAAPAKDAPPASFRKPKKGDPS